METEVVYSPSKNIMFTAHDANDARIEGVVVTGEKVVIEYDPGADAYLCSVGDYQVSLGVPRSCSSEQSLETLLSVADSAYSCFVASATKPKWKFTSQFSIPAHSGESIVTERDALGRYFRATLEQDLDMHEPWKEHDRHGIVRRVRNYSDGDKSPGERLMYRGDRRHDSFLYDVEGTMRKAREESWGCTSHEHATKGEELACAVKQDYEFCRGWANDAWEWVGIRIDLMQEVGEKDGTTRSYVASLWGMESLNEGHYLDSEAANLLAEAASAASEEK